jgi:hypothetical protein
LIIFSKNRPLQLDLCISSIRKNLNIKSDIFVIYNCDKDYEDAYKILKDENSDILFLSQSKSLFRDIMIASSATNNKYITFLTDDCIVYQQSLSFTDNILGSIFEEQLISNFSLRLGENICKRGVGDGVMADEILRYSKNIMILKNNLGMVCYNRTQHFFGGYWNYPISVDGHIFRMSDFKEWINEIVYLEKIKKWQHTPNEFERILQRFANEIGPFQIFNSTSCVVNSPNNRVQNTIENEHGNSFKLHQDHLLECFYANKRINIDKLDFGIIECPHTEIDIAKGLE